MIGELYEPINKSSHAPRHRNVNIEFNVQFYSTTLPADKTWHATQRLTTSKVITTLSQAHLVVLYRELRRLGRNETSS